MVGLTRIVAIVILAYAVLGIAMLRWHLSYGPPYDRPTLGLLGVFAVCAALVGIVSVWAAHGILHWSKRISGLVAAISILSGVGFLFFEWNQFLIWQMLVMLAVQLGALVVVFGILRLLGMGTLKDHSLTIGRQTSRLSTWDLFVLTAAFALFFAVMRTAQPIELGSALYGILIAGGCCAAATSLAAFWISFSNRGLFVRLAVLATVAPIGGWVYAIASQFESLLFNWRWYAGVTTLQMFLMILPFAVARIRGVTFATYQMSTTPGI